MKACKSPNVVQKCPYCRKGSLILERFENSKDLIPFCPNCKHPFIEATKAEEWKNNHNEQLDGNDKTNRSENEFIYWKHVVQLVLIGILIAVAYQFFGSKQKENTILDSILKLKENYPSQNEETWFHILSVFNMTVPSVKTIILFHDHDNRTSNCIIQQLISIYTRGSNVNIKEITYQKVDEIRDYGEVLEYYKPLIRKYGIFVANLQEVSGNIARIFHSLCDDISSDIKPSVFIFTLQYDKTTKNLMPLKRASKILRRIWKEIAENEIWPLLSRIVRNVIEVKPEKNIQC